MTRFSLQPIANSYLLVVVAALILLVLLLLVRPGIDRLARRRWIVLTAIRAGVILLVAMAMLRPTLIYTEKKKQSATLIVMADQSRSMSVADAFGDKSRWEALEDALTAARPAMRALAEDFEVKAYTFDVKPHAATIDDGKITLPESPEGKQTAIGSVLEDVLRIEAGKRLLGVILLSDGAQRAYAPRDLPPQTAAARLKQDGYPLFGCVLGQSRGLGQVQDVAVTELLANQSVFVKNELAVGGQIRIDGYRSKEIPVRLLFETSPGRMEVVAGQMLPVKKDSQLAPIRFSYAPQTQGEFKLTLEAVDQPGELVTTNNRLSTFVNVLGGGLSVLYLEGERRIETKFLRRALDASADIHVDYVRIDAQHSETRPSDLAERLRPGKYDVYILGDLDATAFRDNELGVLAEAVDRGAGLIMLGGFHSFAPGGYATTPLADVLPVGLDRFERQEFGRKIREDVHLPGPLHMRPTDLGLRHFALMLAGSRSENEALWAKLPPLDGANRFRRARLAPGALVLAAAGRGNPLLVAHTYGNGRVMAFAGDSTWRWAMRGFDSAHKRFWRQMVLWLARKDQSIEGNVWVRPAKRRYAPSSRVEITAGAQSGTSEPIADAQFNASVVLPDGTRQPLPLTRNEDQMIGSFRATEAAGDYAIEVEATRDGEPLGSARARFLVFEQDLELDNAAADAASMESLAAMTGGKTLAPEQLPELIEQLAQQTEHLEVLRETKKTFWDKWPFFLGLVALLGVEWYLRKRWGLV